MKPRTAFEEEQHRRLNERDDEMRRQAEVVLRLAIDPRRVLVCSHTEVQFEMFRRDLFRVWDHLGRKMTLGDCRRVRRDGNELRGVGPEHFALVLLEDWERYMEDDGWRQVKAIIRHYGFEPFTT